VLLLLVQISNWFANARRRLKNTVDRAVAHSYRPTTETLDSGLALDWAQRIRLYNRHTVGNQERLSISSTDSDDAESRIIADFDDSGLDDVTGCRDNRVSTCHGDVFTLLAIMSTFVLACSSFAYTF